MIVKTVECDDWVQLYIDDVSVHEGHSLPYQQILPILVRDGRELDGWYRYELLGDEDDRWFRDLFTEYAPGELRLIEEFYG